MKPCNIPYAWPEGSSLVFEVSCCNNGQGSFTVEMLGYTIAEGDTYQSGTSYPFTASQPLNYDLSITNNIGTHLLKSSREIEVNVTNVGTETITSFDLHWSENGAVANSINISGVSIPPFGTYTATHPDAWEATTGIHSLHIWTDNPNGQADENANNNNLEKNVQVVPFLSERIVLFEHFTNASCSNCEFADPHLNDLIGSNAIQIAPINYHTGFPGFDPMYLQSTEFVNARLDYYPPLGVPTAVIDGGLITAPTPTIQTTQIYQLQQRPALFHIALNEKLLQFGVDSGRLVQMDVHITPSMDIISGNHALRIALAEKNVTYDTPPGSANLTFFDYVLRAMLPDADGTPLPDMAAGETQTFSFYTNLPNIADANELRTIAFVQNENTREVEQAYEPNVATGNALMGNTLTLGGIYGGLSVDMQTSGCVDEAAGTLFVTNQGYALPLSYEWSNGQTDANLTELPSGNYTLTVTDGNGNSDVHNLWLPASTGFNFTVNATHDTDNSQMGGASVQLLSGQGPFSYAWSTGETAANIQQLGAGTYELTITDGFGCSQSASVEIDNVTGLNELAASGGLSLFPNPVGNAMHLQLPDLASYERLQIELYDVRGKLSLQKSLQPSGSEQTLRLALNELTRGIYLLHLTAFSTSGKQKRYVARFVKL